MSKSYYETTAWDDNDLMKKIHKVSRDGYKLVSVVPSIEMRAYLIIFTT